MRTLVAGEGWKYDKQFTDSSVVERKLFVGPKPPQTDGMKDKAYLLSYWSHSDSPSDAFLDIDTWRLERELVDKVVICCPADEQIDTSLEIFPSSSLVLHGLDRAVRFLGIVIYLDWAQMLSPNPVVEVNCSFGSHLSDEIARKTVFQVYDTALVGIQHALRINNVPQLQEMAEELNNG